MYLRKQEHSNSKTVKSIHEDDAMIEERAMKRLARAVEVKSDLKDSLRDRGIRRIGSSRSFVLTAQTTTSKDSRDKKLDKGEATGGLGITVTEASTAVGGRIIEASKQSFNVRSANIIRNDPSTHRVWSSSFGGTDREVSDNSHHMSAQNTYRPLSSLPIKSQGTQLLTQLSSAHPAVQQTPTLIITSNKLPFPHSTSLKTTTKAHVAKGARLIQNTTSYASQPFLTVPQTGYSSSLATDPLLEVALTPDRTEETQRQQLEMLRNSTIQVRENKGNYFNKIKHYSRIYNPKEKSHLIFGQQQGQSLPDSAGLLPVTQENKSIRTTTVNMRDYEKSIQERLETFSVFAFSGSGVDKASLAKELDNIGRGASYSRPMGITDLWSKDFHSEVMNKAEHGRFRLRIQRYLHVLHRQGKGNASISRLMLDTKEEAANSPKQKDN